MAGKILNVEKSQFIQKNIDIYTKNRLGQYSKFLSSSPTFVTYYHRNMVESRQDVGTGGIEAENGARSPIRFNKIINLPVYNMPELHPDLTYDETGADIELDCSDLVLLPNTIKPNEGDFFIVQLPGSVEYLFRVNNFNFNTIQSNDFYRFDADVKFIGNHAEERYGLVHQVVETFITVFENIGTEDKCFIREGDVDYVNGLSDLFYKLREYYFNAFYIRDLNTFSFMTGSFSEFGRPLWRYDPYVEKFINESGIFFDENEEHALVLTPADVMDDDFKLKYSQTLYDAVFKHNIEMLRPYEYMVTTIITSLVSMFNISQYNGEAVHVYSYKKPFVKSVSTSLPVCDCCTIQSTGTPGENGSSEVWYDINPMPKCTPTWDLADGKEYMSSEFLKAIKDGCIDTDDLYEVIIFNFLRNVEMKYIREDIIDELEKDERNYMFLPLVIYILGTKFKDYFVSEREIEV